MAVEKYELNRRGVDIIDFGGNPTGVSDSSAALQAGINAGNDTVFIPKGVYLIGQSVIVPKNVALVFAKNARLRIASGKTLTINGVIEALSSDWIFDLSLGGSLSGTPEIKEVYPQWFGAQGKGVTDDTAAFHAALTTAGVATVNVLSGTYLINSTLLVSKKILKCEANVEIKTISDIVLVEIGLDGCLVGGLYATYNNNYTQAVIKVNGKYKINYNTIIENIRIRNLSSDQYKGIGLLLDASEILPPNTTSSIVGATFINTYYRGFETNLVLNVLDDMEQPPFTSVKWINGNNFINQWHDPAKTFILLRGEDNSSRAVDGNHFTNVQMQYDNSVNKGIVCNGDRNYFDVQFWDIGKSSIPTTSSHAIEFVNNATNNIVVTPEMYEKFAIPTMGDVSNMLNSKPAGKPHFYQISKEGGYREMNYLRSTFSDSVLWHAHLRHMVTFTKPDSVTYGRGTYVDLFDPAFQNRLDLKNMTDADVITIRIDFSTRVGFPNNYLLQFVKGWFPRHVKLTAEHYDSQGGSTGFKQNVLIDADINEATIALASKGGSVLFMSRLTLEITGLHATNVNNGIKLYNFFVSSGDAGSLYLQSGGGTMYGDLNMNGKKTKNKVWESCTTATRPTNPVKWQEVIDETLGKPIWWNGTNWQDANKTIV